MKYRSIRSVTSKSAMTPSFSGRTATMLPGVRPIIRLASTPTATIAPVFVFSATTEGSLSTMPRPRTYTRVFAVPRSTAMSRPRNASALLIRDKNLPKRVCWMICGLLTTAHPPAGVQPLFVFHRPAPACLNEVRKEDLDFPFGGVRRVGSVHDVLLHIQRVITTDRARGGGHRIGRAGQSAERLDGPGALDDQGHERSRRDEHDQRREEGPAHVLGVVRLGRFRGDDAHVHRGDL